MVGAGSVGLKIDIEGVGCRGCRRVGVRSGGGFADDMENVSVTMRAEVLSCLSWLVLGVIDVVRNRVKAVMVSQSSNNDDENRNLRDEVWVPMGDGRQPTL